MKKALNGLLAGVVATVVLSVLMVVKAKMGMLPDFNVIAMLAKLVGGGPAAGWAAHILIGVVGYGLVYGVLISGMGFASHVVRGLLLGIVGWVAMMVVVMPMMGVGVFATAMASAIKVPVATLVLHLIFGAVLGLVYGGLDRR